jgi:hypothetical protein
MQPRIRRRLRRQNERRRLRRQTERRRQSWQNEGGVPVMAVIYVARSANLSRWASDVGLGKNVFKVGVSDRPLKELKEMVQAASWAGEADWTVAGKQEIEDVAEEAILERLATKAKHVDPNYYPRIKGDTGIFRVTPVQVQNHLLVARAMAGEELKEIKPKAGDFATYLIQSALG